jgi:cytochrome c-type biogenesis protein CcmH
MKAYFQKGAKRNLLAALLLTLMLSAISVPSPVFAVEPDEVLEDAALEQRARDISEHLRCVVCQSQSIDNSNAPLAKDMRILVRERLQAGDTDKEVYDYLVERYGDYVLLKPPVQENTLFLWAAPAVIFLIAGFAAWSYLNGVRKAAAKRAAAAATAAGGAPSANSADDRQA